MLRRPWHERLVRNVNEITPELITRFEKETGQRAIYNPHTFMRWVGLKDTPTARLRLRSAIAKRNRMRNDAEDDAAFFKNAGI
jgi:hypothetical protein